MFLYFYDIYMTVN